MSRAIDVVVLDVNETLSDLAPLRARFTDSGAPAHLLDTWFASTLRDGFALAAAEQSRPFPQVGAAVLRGLPHGLELSRPLDDAVSHVLEGFPLLRVHPDVPAGLQALTEGGRPRGHPDQRLAVAVRGPARAGGRRAPRGAPAVRRRRRSLEAAPGQLRLRRPDLR